MSQCGRTRPRWRSLGRPDSCALPLKWAPQRERENPWLWIHSERSSLECDAHGVVESPRPIRTASRPGTFSPATRNDGVCQSTTPELRIRDSILPRSTSMCLSMGAIWGRRVPPESARKTQSESSVSFLTQICFDWDRAKVPDWQTSWLPPCDLLREEKSCVESRPELMRGVQHARRAQGGRDKPRCATQEWCRVPCAMTFVSGTAAIQQRKSHCDDKRSASRLTFDNDQRGFPILHKIQSHSSSNIASETHVWVRSRSCVRHFVAGWRCFVGVDGPIG